MIKTESNFEINYIDASSISKFNSCPARYCFERLLGLVPVESSRIAMDFGTAIHRALPYCHINNIGKAKDEFKDEWEKLGYDYNSFDDKKRNKTRAEAMMDNFTKQRCSQVCPYEIQSYPIAAETVSDISLNEVPFLIDIGGQLPAAGRIDAPVKWKSTGDLWCLDYKTASEISGRYFKSFANAPQTILYTIAMSQITGKRAKGMIIDALRVSHVNAETQLAFFYVNDVQISSFMLQANTTAENILKCNESKIWPKCFSSCSSYTQYGIPGGNCPYESLCTAKDWRTVATTFKKVKPFHPFEIVL